MDKGHKELAATAYTILSWAWCILVFGTCTYLVFWKDHSGWWYLLALILAGGSTANGAAKIKGTWRKEMEED